jgi:hypothetical protein
MGMAIQCGHFSLKIHYIFVDTNFWKKDRALSVSTPWVGGFRATQDMGNVLQNSLKSLEIIINPLSFR